MPLFNIGDHVTFEDSIENNERFELIPYIGEIFEVTYASPSYVNVRHIKSGITRIYKPELNTKETFWSHRFKFVSGYDKKEKIIQRIYKLYSKCKTTKHWTRECKTLNPT